MTDKLYNLIDQLNTLETLKNTVDLKYENKFTNLLRKTPKVLLLLPQSPAAASLTCTTTLDLNS